MKMRKLTFIILLLYITGCTANEEQKIPEKPNIIFILTDDLGWGDIGVLYQNERAEESKFFHKTPNLDLLAQEGTILSRHYAPAPVCAPCRASLLLGVHQGHASIRNNQFDKALEDNHTLASVLKGAGYTTGLVGKYGLQGREGDSPDTWEAYPTKRGFDHFFGYVRHVDGHNHYPAHEARKRPPMQVYEGNREISGQLKGCYTTDLFTAAAKKWIIETQAQDTVKPFFLYLAYDTPHAGLQVATGPYPEGGGINGGVQWLGEEDRFINTASEPIDSFIHPDYNQPDWPESQKRFASMVRRIDNAVGDLKILLQDLGLDQNTLIVFSSDNGPHKESYGYGDYDPTFFDSYGPMDGIKRDTWEGGIRVPTIAWGTGIVKQGGSTSVPSGFHDWMATFSEAAGIPTPSRSDGVSLLPQLTGIGVADTSQVYIEYEVGGITPNYEEFHATHQGTKRGQMQVIYLDGYKGVRYNINYHKDDFRIYQTENDTRETQDLAGTSGYFVDLQQRMKQQVLRSRRANASAPRPYDSIPVPSLPESSYSGGLNHLYLPHVYKYVPALPSFGLDTLSREIVPDLTGTFEEGSHFFQGYIKVPEEGLYTFFLQSEAKVVIKLHNALLLDADKGYQGQELTTSILLEAGYHPVQLTLTINEPTTSPLSWQWSIAGSQKQQLVNRHFFH